MVEGEGKTEKECENEKEMEGKSNGITKSTIIVDNPSEEGSLSVIWNKNILIFSSLLFSLRLSFSLSRSSFISSSSSSSVYLEINKCEMRLSSDENFIYPLKRVEEGRMKMNEFKFGPPFVSSSSSSSLFILSSVSSSVFNNSTVANTSFSSSYSSLFSFFSPSPCCYSSSFSYFSSSPPSLNLTSSLTLNISSSLINRLTQSTTTPLLFSPSSSSSSSPIYFLFLNSSLPSSSTSHPAIGGPMKKELKEKEDGIRDNQL
jgi:hypothetical protein